MPGAGKAPKLPEERRNRTPPLRGDWIELPLDGGQKAPKLPAKRPGWSARSKRSWKSWWADPVSSQWSDSDIDLVWHLLYLHEAFVRESTAAAAAEIRQVRDSLGLSPKGRQDRRWRIAAAEEQPEAPKRAATSRSSERRARLTVVK